MICLGESAQAVQSAGPTLRETEDAFSGFSDLEEYTTTRRTTETGTSNLMHFRMSNAQG
jgi:hypothetical protein